LFQLTTIIHAGITAWLRQQSVHPRFRKIEMGIFRDYGHLFRLSRPEDLDEGLVELLYEAYILGCES
jgi:hypothetical protein